MVRLCLNGETFYGGAGNFSLDGIIVVPVRNNLSFVKVSVIFSVLSLFCRVMGASGAAAGVAVRLKLRVLSVLSNDGTFLKLFYRFNRSSSNDFGYRFYGWGAQGPTWSIKSGTSANSTGRKFGIAALYSAMFTELNL